MPYALADDWFAGKLNSVSISFQRQIMGKTKKDGKKSETGKEEARMQVDSPSTRSRLSSMATGQVKTQAEVHPPPKKQQKKKESSKKSEADSDRGSVASSSASKTFDVAYFVQEAVRRLEAGELAVKILQDMPRAHKKWTEARVRACAKDLNIKLRTIHLQAMGLRDGALTAEKDEADRRAAAAAARAEQSEDMPKLQAETSPPVAEAKSTPEETVVVESSEKPAAPAPSSQVTLEMVDGQLCLRDQDGNAFSVMTKPLAPATSANESATRPVGMEVETKETPSADLSESMEGAHEPTSSASKKEQGNSIPPKTTPLRQAEMSPWTGGSLFNFKRPTPRAASPSSEATPTLSRGLISAGPTSIISRRPPQDYILPRDHPWPTDFIRPEEAMEEDAWKYVWRDEEFFEELGPQDAQILVETAGINHFFDNTNDGGFTVSGDAVI